MMIVVRLFARLFLLPGDIVRRKIGMTVTEDGGLLRSIVNMIVWGTVILLIWVAFFE